MSGDEIRSLVATWHAALRTGDVAAVVRLYAPDAVLLPTFTNRVRRGHPEIVDSFGPFVARGASAAVDGLDPGDPDPIGSRSLHAR